MIRLPPPGVKRTVADPLADSPHGGESVMSRICTRHIFDLPDAQRRGSGAFGAGRVLCTIWAETCLTFDDRFPPPYSLEPRAAIFLSRHLDGDWGDVPADLACANRKAVGCGNGRITSLYLMDTHRANYMIRPWTPMAVTTEPWNGITLFFVERDLYTL